MAVNIEEFKRDLDQLKSQRSVVQAKLDEAVKHAAEIEQTLKSFGYNSVEEAEQAYARQLQQAEQQHEQVKKLIVEIQSLDQKLPTREEVAQRLQSLSVGQIVPPVVSVPQVATQDVIDQPVPSSETTVTDNPPMTVVYNDPTGSGLVAVKSDVSIVEDTNPIVDSVVQFAKQDSNVKETPKQTNDNVNNIDLGNILFSSL